jgi:hypothetical protein
MVIKLINTELARLMQVKSLLYVPWSEAGLIAVWTLEPAVLTPDRGAVAGRCTAAAGTGRRTSPGGREPSMPPPPLLNRPVVCHRREGQGENR